MDAIKGLKHIFYLNRYHEYFTDTILSKLLISIWRIGGRRRFGIQPKLRGLPLISVVSGSSVTIGDRAYLVSRSRNTALGVNHPIILRTLRPTAQIRIGSDFRASGVTICAACQIEIGDRVVLGANVVVVDTDFHASDSAVRSSLNDFAHAKCSPVNIGSDVFIGMNSMVLKGVTIGAGARVGAGAIVTRDVPPRTVAAGNPARIIV